jgi:hypothetical protein
MSDDPLDDPRVQAGMEHLQRAAREVIAAGRALLDAAEDLVDDPRAAAGVLETLSSLVERGRSAATGSATDPEDDDDGGTVQRIPVS